MDCSLAVSSSIHGIVQAESWVQVVCVQGIFIAQVEQDAHHFRQIVYCEPPGSNKAQATGPN